MTLAHHGEVALSFDDGPDPAGTPLVLEALAAADLVATFFVMGSAVRAYPDLLRHVVEAGHAVGLHCDQHLRHDALDGDALRADTTAALAALADHGVPPTQWRVPWGVLGPATRAVAEEHDLQLVGWTADTEDWAGEDAAALLARVDPRLVDGAVLLAHDGLGPGALRTDCAATAAWVGIVAEAARARGLTFGPIGASATADRPPRAGERAAAAQLTLEGSP